jgi:hypothetical protein
VQVLVERGVLGGALYRLALERTPEDASLYQHLHRLWAGAEDGRGLVELLTFRIVHVPPDLRMPLYAERSELRARLAALPAYEIAA